MALSEKKLEFLYREEGEFLFLDVGQLEQVMVSHEIIGEAHLYLKEGIQIRATVNEKARVVTVQLPPFLELMVIKVEKPTKATKVAQENKVAHLETGACVLVPLYVEVGDVIKVAPEQHEFIQRV